MYWTTLNIYFTIIGICFLLSLSVYFRQPVPIYLKLIPPFLVITLIENIWAHFMGERTGNNHIIHNFYSVLFFSFYSYILSHIIQHPGVKKIILHTCWVFPLIAFGNIFFGQGLYTFHTITHSLGAMIAICFCGWYFWERTGSDQPLTETMTDPGFWICAGLSLFFPITFLFFGSLYFIESLPPVFVDFMVITLWVGNWILYISFSIGFYYFIKNSQPKIRKQRTNKA